MSVIYKKPHIKNEFPEIFLTYSHTLPKGTYKLLPVHSVFLDRPGWNSAQKIPIKNYWTVVSFMKIGVMKATLYLRE